MSIRLYRVTGKYEAYVLALLASFTPEFIGARWQWYRRAVGGRWCFYWYRLHNTSPWGGDGWRRVPRCPHLKGASLLHSCSGYAAECQMDGECHCEVWS